jgi:Predicted pPIWI-associating nuclease
MARRMTVSEYNNHVRRLQREQKRAIDNHNRQVRSHNQKVQRAEKKSVDDYNRKVNAHNQKVQREQKKAVDNYNREIRAYNQRVKSNRQRLKNEINKMNRSTTSTTKYTVYQSSVINLNSHYESLDQRAEHGGLNEKYNHFVDLSEKEAANSVEVLNALVDTDENQLVVDLEKSAITDHLLKISLDLDNRWKGAIFSLSPRNPDAARHFCTSAREVITQILEIQAPDSQVISLLPDCTLTDRGKPTRRSKIKYLLTKKELFDSDFVNFVEEDMSNIVELFRVFNDGTHGSSGTFSLSQLSSIKNRVEDGIIFLSEIAS